MRHLFILYLLLLSQPSYSQITPERIKGLSTNELYDLHVDHKGYLWIAHSLGLSRYDGLNFTTYSHPGQINLRTNDIVEDSHGRIWFHNFSGQVFYIENGVVHLLNSYDYLHENQSPRMAICGNHLLVTSYKGLFVCNTDDLTTKFYPFQRTVATALVSLAVLENKAVVYNNLDWYLFDGKGLHRLTKQPSLSLPADDFVSLQPATFRDTLFLTANPSGDLYKLKVEKNNVVPISRHTYHDFISAVTVDDGVWVHTRNRSIHLRTGNTINNTDLTDVVKDREGNVWYGSRREGLLAAYRPSFWQRVNFQIGKNDYIRSLNANAGYFFAGTQEGTLYTFRQDSASADWKKELFNGLGSIDFIRYISNDRFVVSSSTNSYLVNARDQRIEAELPIRGIVDVDFDGNSFYLATNVGLYIAPLNNWGAGKQQWLQQKKEQFPFVNWHDSNAAAYLLLPQRTRSVRYDPLYQRVYASTKNGLVKIDNTGPRPFLINHQNIYSTTLAYRNGRLYIGTVNDGLWLVAHNKLQHFTTANTLASNTLIRIKATEDHLWLFERDGIQVLDIHTDEILRNLDLPKIEGANILDVAEKDHMSYLTSSGGVYRIPFNQAAEKMRPAGFLDYVLVNGTDTLQRPAEALPYQKNDVQFYFSSPSFYEPSDVSFRYRLKGVENEWHTTSPAERMIRYSSLTPGNYSFELYAINSDGLRQETVLRFPFTINKPWWQTVWFYVLVNLLIIAILYLLIRNRIKQELRIERIRRNISSDLHDDIGATLSSINFYIDLARSEKENETYLQQIKENVAHVIASLDDLVWSINPKNDTTEQFIHRMKNYAVPLLRAVRIQCHFSYDPQLLQQKLNLDTKRNLYLLFKEMVNNVAKHSRCCHCIIRLQYQQGHLCLSVTDDGQGFDPLAHRPDRNGLFTMQDRTRRLNGEIEIKSAPARGSEIEITIPV